MSMDPASRDGAQKSLQDVLAIRRHTTDFGRTWTDRDWRREVLARARGVRQARPELPPIDLLMRPEDDYLVGTGELLIRTDALDDRARRLVQAAGFAAEPVECLRGRVQQLRMPGATAEALATWSEKLRARDVPVAFNFVPPMAVVMKAQGGPEPAARSWPPRVPSTYGGPVRVAMIDTGVTDQTRTDGWLQGLAAPGADRPAVRGPHGRRPDAGRGRRARHLGRRAGPARGPVGDPGDVRDGSRRTAQRWSPRSPARW